MKTVMQKIVDKRDRVYISELFREIEKTDKKTDKIALLQAYSKKGSAELDTLRAVIECLFHPKVSFDLPEGDPPFKTDYADHALAPSSLFREVKRIRYFINNHSAKIQQPLKRERLFIQMLESMHKEESLVLLAMKDRRPRKFGTGLTEALAREAFPEWLPVKEEKGSEVGK